MKKFFICEVDDQIPYGLIVIVMTLILLDHAASTLLLLMISLEQSDLLAERLNEGSFDSHRVPA